MAHMNELATEIIDIIVQLIQATSPKSLLSVNLTCRRLHRAARLYLWKDISLQWKLNKKSSIAKFIQGHPGNDAIKSLRLWPQRGLLNGFSIGMKSSYDRIDSLCACLNSFPNLQTFSIYMRNQVDRRCLLPGSVIAQIVTALPPSVINLEIDTEGIAGVWQMKKVISEPSKHLCHAIGTIIPQLETLRLGLSSICPDLFHALRSTSSSTQPTSRLRLVGIDLEVSPTREAILGTPRSVNDCHLPPGSLSNAGTGRLQPSTLFKPLLDLQKSGAFPNLQRFLLLTLSSRNRYFRARDVATGTMTQYPFEWVNGTSFWGSEPFPIHADEFFMVRAHNYKIYLGEYNRIIRSIMHEVAWCDGEGGVRIPPSKQVNKADPQMDTKQLVSIEDVETKLLKISGSGRIANLLPTLDAGKQVMIYRPMHD